jgi:hypothetical protein
MAKYHVTIESSHWTGQFPGFLDLPVHSRSQLVRKEVERIQNFLESEMPEGTVSLLVTDQSVVIDPLHGDIKCHKLVL